jgi:hypothetical protein
VELGFGRLLLLQIRGLGRGRSRARPEPGAAETSVRPRPRRPSGQQGVGSYSHCLLLCDPQKRKSRPPDSGTQPPLHPGCIFGGVGPILQVAYLDPPTAPGGHPGPGECGRRVRGGRSRRWCGMPPRRIRPVVRGDLNVTPMHRCNIEGNGAITIR